MESMSCRSRTHIGKPARRRDVVLAKSGLEDGGVACGSSPRRPLCLQRPHQNPRRSEPNGRPSFDTYHCLTELICRVPLRKVAESRPNLRETAGTRSCEIQPHKASNQCLSPLQINDGVLSTTGSRPSMFCGTLL